MFLDKKILELGHSIAYGSVTLKSLQNENIPEIDLLVREAVQNSSDASLGEPEDSFTVKFNTGTFVPSKFNTNLSGIEDILDEKFPEETAEFLEIRDTKTAGLTGPIHMKDVLPKDHGNFFKLIFDTGKKQTQNNAGGNWGFGKSVYYRIGSGIVVFYSRIRKGEDYESRLIITLVEDEEKQDSILGRISNRAAGKAWWGIEDGEDLLPLTDDIFINEILEVFGVDPFKANETGTSIIIPYIRTNELLKNIIPAEANISDDIRDRCTWANNFEEYLVLAIQKWYAPKIQNRHLKDFCDKKWLRVYVNNKPIRYDDMLPFFKLVQELYTIAIAKTYASEYSSEWLDGAKCLPVNIRNYFNTSDGANSTAGYVAAIKITTEEMYGGQNYMDPCIYTRHFENDPDINEPIVMYARDPGMVIEYTISGPWVKGITAPEGSDEFIFAFFVPITSKSLKADLSEKKFAGMQLGEYLRNCEASDHMGWNDPANMQVVERIQKNTVEQICKKIVATQTVQIEATASKLSGKLGRKLLPRVGYGKTKRIGGGSGGSGGGGAKINNLMFAIVSQNMLGSELTIGWELKLTQMKKNAEFTILVDSEGGLIDPQSWMSDIGTQFPIEIDRICVKSISSSTEAEQEFSDFICDENNSCVSNEYMEVNLVNNGGCHLFTISSKISVPTIKGELTLKTADKKYRPLFKVV